MQNWKYKIWLALIIIIAYWPISSGIFFFDYDMMDCWLPWRHFIGEHIRAGELPLWNPYQACGSPIYADLQGPLWSPESYISSLLFKDTTIAINFLYIFYLCIAAWGMFELVYYLSKNTTHAFLLALIFPCSGFFYGHSQHFYAIISGAWFPFLFLYGYKLITESHLKSGLAFALVAFMCNTTGNPTFMIISIYIFLVLIIRQVSINIQEKNQRNLALFKNTTITGICAILLHAVIILAAYQSFPYISRNQGLSIEQASKIPFTFASSLSYIFPVAAQSNSDFFGTVTCMRNYYIGVFIFLLFIYMLIKSKKDRNDWLFLSIAFICWLASMGRAGGVFTLLFNYIPGFNLFRFPAYYHFFSSFFVLIYIGKNLKEIDFQKYIDLLKKYTILITCSLFACAIFIYITHSNTIQNIFSISGFITALRSPDIYTGFFINLLFLSILWLVFSIKKAIQLHWFTFFITIEMIGSLWLSIWQVSPLTCPRNDLSEGIAKVSQLPPDREVLISHSDEGCGIPCLWRNTNIFKHRVTPSYFNSFELDTFVKFESQQKQLMEYMLAHSLLYNPTEDSISSVVSNEKISNNQIEFDIKSPKNTTWVLLQSYFPGWKVYIDDKEAPLSQEFCFMKIESPFGSHHLTFQFQPPLIYQAAALSYLSFFMIILGLLISERRNRSKLFKIE